VYPALLDKLYQNPLPWSSRFDLDGTPTLLSHNRQQLLLAQILILTADYPRALGECDAALAEQPDLGEAYAMRAMVYRKSGNLELSLSDYHQAIELSTGERRATAYRERAGVYHDCVSSRRHSLTVLKASRSIP
jgi:tetratricopeptide (TPR) repeat protein